MARAVHVLVVSALVAALGSSARADWFDARHGRAPAGLRVYICHGYGCRIVTPVQLSEAEFAQIASPLKRGASNPAKEREALSHAVQTFERIVGRHVGTGNDLAGTQIGQAADDQMDCIDEATNTTSLLTVLEARGALKQHRVDEPAARGFFLDGRYPHATAVITETAGGAHWAVDSWPRANGEPPVIQPLSVWYAGRGGNADP